MYNLHTQIKVLLKYDDKYCQSICNKILTLSDWEYMSDKASNCKPLQTSLV